MLTFGSSVRTIVRNVAVLLAGRAATFLRGALYVDMAAGTGW
jgi:hypothetical protein